MGRSQATLSVCQMAFPQMGSKLDHGEPNSLGGEPAAFGGRGARREFIQVMWEVVFVIVTAVLQGLQGVVCQPEPGQLNEQIAG